MNVAGSMNRKQEAFYWCTILVSNTLGTALGDFFSDSLEFGFAISASIFSSALMVCVLLAYFSPVPHVILFWIAFVLTRPFGATFGDLLTKSKAKGGLELGTLCASLVILALFLVSFAFEMYYLVKDKKAKALKDITGMGIGSEGAAETSAVKTDVKALSVEEEIDEEFLHVLSSATAPPKTL
jgi:hypothetical protein